MKVNIDSSELRTLSADFRAIPPEMIRHTTPVVERGANNIKREIRANFQGSEHFSPVARSVRYNLSRRSAFGEGQVEAEIGPMPDGRPAPRADRKFAANDPDFAFDRGKDDPSPLAHIAIHGTARGGGGSVEDPKKALENEAPKFAKALGDLAEELLY